jgi:hypothetical protein
MQEIDKEKKAIRQFLRFQWLNYLVVSGISPDKQPQISHEDTKMWCKQEDYMKQQIVQLNRKVDDFNLQKPERMDFIFRLRLHWTEEVKRAQQPLSQEECDWVKSKQMERMEKYSLTEKVSNTTDITSARNNHKDKHRLSLSKFLFAVFG